MSTELLDPPVQQPTSAPVTQSGDLKGLLEASARNPSSDSAFKATPSTPEQALDTPQKNGQQAKPAEQKPAKAKAQQKAAETVQKDGKQKGKWAGLEALKSPETAEEEASGEESQGEQAEGAETLSTESGEQQEPQSPQARRWSELRSIEEKYKEIAPAFEKLQKDFDDLKSKGGMTEEQKHRYDHLEQMYAVELLDTKPEFQQEVIAPMQEHLNGLASVANHAKLDATQRQALRSAAEEKDAFSRIRAIKQVIGAAEGIEDPEEVQTLVQFALDAANKYQDAKKKEEAYVAKATEMAHSARGKEAQMSAQQKAAKQAEYENAHKEMIGTLKPPLQPLFDDPEFGPQLNEALESIRPAESPMDQAYQAQAGEILPFAVKVINKLKSELSAARKSLKAREAAKPKTTDGTTPAAEQGQQQPDLKHLLNTSIRG